LTHMELLIVLLVVFGLITLVGHGIWVSLRWLIRQLIGSDTADHTSPLSQVTCARCKRVMDLAADPCFHCGLPRVSSQAVELLDLEATERQLDRWHGSGAVAEEIYQTLKETVAAQRGELEGQKKTAPSVAPAANQMPATLAPVSVASSCEPLNGNSHREPLPSVIDQLVDDSTAAAEFSWQESAPRWEKDSVSVPPSFTNSGDAADSSPQLSFTPPARRSFTEVLSAFMEESNIRWGE